MGRFRNYVSAAAGLVILAGAFTVFGPFVDQGQADPRVKSVNVVNTPLPVTGILAGDVRVTNTTAEPVPVEVQNGNVDETIIITLAENLETATPTEFDAVDTSGFRFVTFLASGNFRGETLRYSFSTQAGKFSDAIPKTKFSE